VLKNLSAAQKELMDKNFAHSLSFTNDGIIESALAVVTMIKLDLPADEFPMIKNKIEYLADHCTKPMIRYRACLARAVFDNPAKFKKEAAYQYSDADAFFNALDNNTINPLLSSD
jgi:hypothetical protein